VRQATKTRPISARLNSGCPKKNRIQGSALGPELLDPEDPDHDELRPPDQLEPELREPEDEEERDPLELLEWL
jgi:hypothetical protein